MKEVKIDFDKLNEVAETNKSKYVSGNPFPHIYFDNLFDEELLSDIVSEFPNANDIDWIKMNAVTSKKLASKDELQFGHYTRTFIHILNSKPFLTFLEKLTGIENLIPDPSLEGGGLHQILTGGFLKVHADFNKHHHTNLDRRLNVIVYLNKDWKEEYGGFFELWNQDMSEAVVKLLPVFNRMAIFSTTSTSYHGHPDLVTCPEDRSRKSIALFYYTNGRPQNEIIKGLEAHSTLYKNRGSLKEVENNSIRTTILQIAKKFVPPIFLDIKRKLF
jgi:Rps23 Pro-64 3,4-dihydroxylase Tpa1-like proline 4-hydroxylase